MGKGIINWISRLKKFHENSQAFRRECCMLWSVIVLWCEVPKRFFFFLKSRNGIFPSDVIYLGILILLRWHATLLLRPFEISKIDNSSWWSTVSGIDFEDKLAYFCQTC